MVRKERLVTSQYAVTSWLPNNNKLHSIEAAAGLVQFSDKKAVHVVGVGVESSGIF